MMPNQRWIIPDLQVYSRVSNKGQLEVLLVYYKNNYVLTITRKCMRFGKAAEEEIPELTLRAENLGIVNTHFHSEIVELRREREGYLVHLKHETPQSIRTYWLECSIKRGNIRWLPGTVEKKWEFISSPPTYY